MRRRSYSRYRHAAEDSTGENNSSVNLSRDQRRSALREKTERKSGKRKSNHFK